MEWLLLGALNTDLQRWVREGAHGHAINLLIEGVLKWEVR